MSDRLELRVLGAAALPTLIYLPGLHGDWTLMGSFRKAIEGRVRLVEFAYPRTTAWSLDDYAQQIVTALAAQGITRGWLLAESFGSQVAWAILQAAQNATSKVPQGFTAEGMILAGGFVRHPVIGGVKLARGVCAWIPPWLLGIFLWAYPKYARFRHRQAPETLRDIDEFVRRRRVPGDREAMAHRLNLIGNAEFRELARATRLPVFSLTGFWDPIVLWWPVQTWLRRECPGWCGDRMLYRADHTVLATQPEESVKQVLEWMGQV
ncbi:MAG TPA: alpha/beta hydrolase [Candidatus Limnocylindria bacterium]|jgi:pimeloyl-ACP methyl ester carboxylesterase|nr:alpha/beta hydrolase [Candidatus Limnocylindria bacterium]